MPRSKYVEWRDATILLPNERHIAPSTLDQGNANSKVVRNALRAEHDFALLTEVDVVVCTPAVTKVPEIRNFVRLMEADVVVTLIIAINLQLAVVTNVLHMEVDDAVNLMAATKAHNQVHPFAFAMEVEGNVNLRTVKRLLEGKVVSACPMQHNYKR